MSPDERKKHRELVRREREKELRHKLGVPPEAAGAAAMLGAEMAAGPALVALPGLLHQALSSGEAIDKPPGTALSPPKKLRQFAEAKGVRVPFMASGDSRLSAYMPEESGVQALLSKLFGHELPPEGIYLGTTSVPVAMHEIGHAAPIAKTKILVDAWKALQDTTGQGSPIGFMIRAALGAQVLARPDEDASDTRKFMYEHAPALVGATTLPQLLEEARASGHALHGARKYGPGILATLKELAPAYGTYLGGAALPVLGTLLAKRLMETLREQGEAGHAKKASVLKLNAQAAWRIGGKPQVPKNTPVGPAKDRATAKPPSNEPYFRDLLESLYSPSRGNRLSNV